ncbi:MAG: hypothetical protein J6Z35_02855 [Lachnospiraceae bacterium]|nr:hypothetical protein [Lachnospiraceae bacterium]
MKKLKNLITFLCLSIFSILLSGPMKVLAANSITGPVEAYTYKAQTVTFQLQTDNPWRAETDYDFIHLNDTTGYAGSSSLSFRLDENTSSNSRMGWIVVYDQRMYYPIFTIEINQAGSQAPPPAVGPYFANDTDSLKDNQVTDLAWNTSSFRMKFMSNRNITVKIDGRVITMQKTSNGNGYTYEYTHYMGYNYTKTKRSYTIDVTVDGKNVTGGDHHTYYIRQNRTPVILNDLKILDGYVSSSEDSSLNKPLKIQLKTNDDLETWYTWKSTNVWGSSSTKSTDKNPVSINLDYYTIEYGTTVIITSDVKFEKASMFRERSDLKLHVRSKSSGIERVVDITMNEDLKPAPAPTPTPKPTATPKPTPTPTPTPVVDDSIKIDPGYVSVNSWTTSDFKLGMTISTNMNANSVSVHFWDINRKWVIVEIYSEGGIADNAYKGVKLAAEGEKLSNRSINLDCHYQTNAERYKYLSTSSSTVVDVKDYTRSYYIMTQEAYAQTSGERYNGYSESDFFLGLKSNQYIKLFSVKYPNK